VGLAFTGSGKRLSACELIEWGNSPLRPPLGPLRASRHAANLKPFNGQEFEVERPFFVYL